mmetsp:Transcript_2447/g.8228  ORF Transcript_2447/g.8228 Transcript_2447/m.8228 type:complete len:258 (-) Transcript_2447:1163-1936(-)
MEGQLVRVSPQAPRLRLWAARTGEGSACARSTARPRNPPRRAPAPQSSPGAAGRSGTTACNVNSNTSPSPPRRGLFAGKGPEFPALCAPPRPRGPRASPNCRRSDSPFGASSRLPSPGAPTSIACTRCEIPRHHMPRIYRLALPPLPCRLRPGTPGPRPSAPSEWQRHPPRLVATELRLDPPIASPRQLSTHREAWMQQLGRARSPSWAPGARFPCISSRQVTASTTSKMHRLIAALRPIRSPPPAEPTATAAGLRG